MNGKADIKARVYFYRTEDGGIDNPLSGKIRCPSYINKEYFDCGFNLEKDRKIFPGDTITVQIIFLSPKIVRPLLSVGNKFKLWAGKFIADCVVEEIIPE